MKIEISKESVGKIYSSMRKNLERVRLKLNRPLTLAEKILYSHLANPDRDNFTAEDAVLNLLPDRVAMQDATAQMALLQFAQAKIKRAAVPATVHCDHLIRAHRGAGEDLRNALEENKEVYDFLSSAAGKFGIGFWKPGSGIIHQIVFENYAFPGGLMIGTDSHTPNAGGLGMIAVGVGGADAVGVLAGLHWEVKKPKLIGVKLTGRLSGWTSPKDLILYLCGLLTVKGGTNRIIEYFGEGTQSISCTGKSTVTNMGAELGATTSLFPFDDRMADYLKATHRPEIAELAQGNADLLRADDDVLAHPEKYFERLITINLSQLEPHIVGPHTPDLARPLSKFSKEIEEKNYPRKISSALIGSCTNSSYEDLGRAAEIAAQARSAQIKMNIPFLIAPGSEQIFETVKRDGYIESFEAIGGTVLANACGPCIGQWKREDMKSGEPNAILTSFNRNFPKRNDGNPGTLAFIASPEIVVASALSGRLGFNPLTDTIETEKGKKVKLSPPSQSSDLPKKGFISSTSGYIPPAPEGEDVPIIVDPKSERLQLLEPFPAWDGKDLNELPILFKAKGKCTTDHISPAGPWLKFRGHLERISDNVFLGAVNTFTGETGKGMHMTTREKGVPLPEIARSYRTKGIPWVVIGDENYGEGSSREHAAMSPRYLLCAAVIARSFARIHETNLKKQGILPLTFVNPSDYDKILETDRISVIGLKNLASGEEVTAFIHHSEGGVEKIHLKQSMTPQQIEWFRAGSALNILKSGKSG